MSIRDAMLGWTGSSGGAEGASPAAARLSGSLRDLRGHWRDRKKRRSSAWRDFAAGDFDLIQRVAPYTMTSWARIYALARASEYVVSNGIPGAFVECGVWRGGSMMAAAIKLLEAGVRDRDLYLFDTFSGMPEPSEVDVSIRGAPAREIWREQVREDGESDWCRAGVEEVREALAETGYPEERIHCVEGLVEETIPDQAPDEIALLRLDTDWYESTLHELVHLYPRLAVGGVLIIDDYGEWKGARQAVDEYVRDYNVPLLLNRLDSSARMAVKLR